MTENWLDHSPGEMSQPIRIAVTFASALREKPVHAYFNLFDDRQSVRQCVATCLASGVPDYHVAMWHPGHKEQNPYAVYVGNIEDSEGRRDNVSCWFG